MAFSIFCVLAKGDTSLDECLAGRLSKLRSDKFLAALLYDKQTDDKCFSKRSENTKQPGKALVLNLWWLWEDSLSWTQADEFCSAGREDGWETLALCANSPLAKLFQQPDFDQQVLRGGEPRELVACRDQYPGFSAPPAADAVATANWVLGDVLFVMSLVLVMHLVVDLKYSYYQGCLFLGEVARASLLSVYLEKYSGISAQLSTIRKKSTKQMNREGERKTDTGNKDFVLQIYLECGYASSDTNSLEPPQVLVPQNLLEVPGISI
ncbi:hypothetical protein Anapl_03900 [Anas platyrhynchos]|uniref:Uncharacterized protein n=1 Tax=Anas platyrhynchos TaxID=8839 RepID=R0JGF2_ANAPL|nr:hypothetical protein Anapl_03900 [Anas platyrhynchos]